MSVTPHNVPTPKIFSLKNKKSAAKNGAMNEVSADYRVWDTNARLA